MAFVQRLFQYLPVPVLSTICREDSVSTTSPALVEVGTSVDFEFKGGVYIIGAGVTIAPVAGSSGTVEFLAGSDVVLSITLPNGASSRGGGLFVLNLSGVETRHLAWRARSDGVAPLDLSDLHFLVIAIGPPSA